MHVFGRRGPAQAKFTPMELRELDHSPTIEVIVDPEDIDYDEGSIATRRNYKQADMVANTWRTGRSATLGDRPHKLFLHFFESPVEILGEDGKVVGLRTERTELDGTGNVKGTGEFTDWDVRRSTAPSATSPTDLPETARSTTGTGTVPNEAGRVHRGVDGAKHRASTYVTGWIKRGPVGLIGHTKGDANETVACLLDDYASRCTRPSPETPEESAIELPRRARTSATPRGTAGTGSTRTSAHSASPRAASASRSSSARTCSAHLASSFCRSSRLLLHPGVLSTCHFQR